MTRFRAASGVPSAKSESNESLRKKASQHSRKNVPLSRQNFPDGPAPNNHRVLLSSANHCRAASMAKRQLGNMTIDTLEALFDEKRNNLDVLTTLLAELAHRKMPRAKKLKRRVLQALSVAAKAGSGSEAKARSAGGEGSDGPLTVEEHRRVAAHLRQGDPDWNEAELKVALQFAKHHDFLADLIERRQSDKS
jgi:hypothetical protein